MSAVTKMEQPSHDLSRQALTPMEAMYAAVERGASVEVVERMAALAERWEANQARKAFDAAMAAAKAAMPAIARNRHVKYDKVDYRHEDLGEIAKAVGPVLAEQGLSYRFRTTSAEAGSVAVTCIISHRDGHSEETTLSAAHDKSGGKNAIQAIGSAVTYLQRYTLKAALGLAAAADDDGKASGSEDAEQFTISNEQIETLRKALTFVGGNEEKFCRSFKVNDLSCIYESRFKEAFDIINAKGRQS